MNWIYVICILWVVGFFALGAYWCKQDEKRPKSSIDRMCEEISEARRDNNYNVFTAAAKEEEKLKYDRKRESH